MRVGTKVPAPSGGTGDHPEKKGQAAEHPSQHMCVLLLCQARQE